MIIVYLFILIINKMRLSSFMKKNELSIIYLLFILLYFSFILLEINREDDQKERKIARSGVRTHE